MILTSVYRHSGEEWDTLQRKTVLTGTTPLKRLSIIKPPSIMTIIWTLWVAIAISISPSRGLMLTTTVLPQTASLTGILALEVPLITPSFQDLEWAALKMTTP